MTKFLSRPIALVLICSLIQDPSKAEFVFARQQHGGQAQGLPQPSHLFTEQAVIARVLSPFFDSRWPSSKTSWSLAALAAMLGRHPVITAMNTKRRAIAEWLWDVRSNPFEEVGPARATYKTTVYNPGIAYKMTELGIRMVLFKAERAHRTVTLDLHHPSANLDKRLETAAWGNDLREGQDLLQRLTRYDHEIRRYPFVITFDDDPALDQGDLLMYISRGRIYLDVRLLKFIHDHPQQEDAFAVLLGNARFSSRTYSDHHHFRLPRHSSGHLYARQKEAQIIQRLFSDFRVHQLIATARNLTLGEMAIRLHEIAHATGGVGPAPLIIAPDHMALDWRALETYPAQDLRPLWADGFAARAGEAAFDGPAVVRSHFTLDFGYFQESGGRFVEVLFLKMVPGQAQAKAAQRAADHPAFLPHMTWKTIKMDIDHLTADLLNYKYDQGIKRVRQEARLLWNELEHAGPNVQSSRVRLLLGHLQKFYRIAQEVSAELAPDEENRRFVLQAAMARLYNHWRGPLTPANYLPPHLTMRFSDPRIGKREVIGVVGSDNTLYHPSGRRGLFISDVGKRLDLETPAEEVFVLLASYATAPTAADVMVWKIVTPFYTTDPRMAAFGPEERSSLAALFAEDLFDTQEIDARLAKARAILAEFSQDPESRTLVIGTEPAWAWALALGDGSVVVVEEDESELQKLLAYYHAHAHLLNHGSITFVHGRLGDSAVDRFLDGVKPFRNIVSITRPLTGDQLGRLKSSGPGVLYLGPGAKAGSREFQEALTRGGFRVQSARPVITPGSAGEKNGWLLIVHGEFPALSRIFLSLSHAGKSLGLRGLFLIIANLGFWSYWGWHYFSVSSFIPSISTNISSMALGIIFAMSYHSQDPQSGSRQSFSSGWFAKHRPRTVMDETNVSAESPDVLRDTLRETHRYLEFIRQKEYAKAARLLESDLAPDTAARLFLAQSLEDEGYFQQAALVLSEPETHLLDGRFRSIPEARLLWSILQEQLGNITEALAALTGGSPRAALDPIFLGNEYALACFARQLGLNGKPREGLSLLLEGTHIRRNYYRNPDIVMAASELYLIMNDLNAAREMLSNILRRYPYNEDLSVLVLLERIRHAANEYARALQMRASPPTVADIMERMDEQESGGHIYRLERPYLKMALQMVHRWRPNRVLVVGSAIHYLAPAIEKMGIDVVCLDPSTLLPPLVREEQTIKGVPLAKLDVPKYADRFDLVIAADPLFTETGPFRQALAVIFKVVRDEGIVLLPQTAMISESKLISPKAYYPECLTPMKETLYTSRSERHEWLAYVLPRQYSRAYRVSKGGTSVFPSLESDRPRERGHGTRDSA